MSLEKKIEKSEKIIKKAFSIIEPQKLAIAFTGGKDSTVMLHIVKKVLKNNITNPILFIDESHFDEVYEFVDKITNSWNLNLIVEKDEETLKKYFKTNNIEEKKKLAQILKINAIKKAVEKHKWQGLMVAIRRDEHPAREKEVYFSPRKNPKHLRIHPILHFTEKDIWSYIKKFKVPYNPLYDKGYRSLGEKEFTKPVKNKNLPERAGREQTKEEIMEDLRKLGYF